MTFWIIIGVTGLAVAAVITRAMLRRQDGAMQPAQYDLQIYRDQLKEVERDLARGVLGAEEAERARIEVSRRILAADAQGRDAETRDGRGPGLVLALVIGALLAGGSVWMYSDLGAPGYGDLPIADRLARSEALRADRMSQAQAEKAVAGSEPAPLPQPSPEFLEVVEALRARLQAQPDDPRGVALLARTEAELGRSKAAYAAQAHLLELKGETATASEHVFYADQLISAAHGYVSSDAEAALRAALARDPDQPVARYYQAQYLLQVDRPDAAFRIMEALLRGSAPDAAWLPAIRAQIEDVAWRAGVNYRLPDGPGMAGPDKADIAAAQEMEAGDRQAMIEGMVTQLSDRLASEGGSAQEWARLIRALAVLERFERARTVYGEAQEVFAGREADLNLLREAAQGIGGAE